MLFFIVTDMAATYNSCALLQVREFEFPLGKD